MSIEIQVVDDPAQVCADALSAAAATGEHVVLTGGSTPKHAYELAAAQHAAVVGRERSSGSPTTAASSPTTSSPTSGWSRSRCSTRSSAAGVEVEFCRRILGERGYEEGALEYERELEHVGGGPGAIRFELVLLGVGSDGHICSMFPGQESLDERSRLAVGVPEAGLEPFVPRVTLTFPALSRAKRVLVLATGASKADPIAAAFAEDAPHTHDVPASLLAEHVEDIVVLLDEAAASRL